MLKCRSRRCNFTDDALFRRSCAISRNASGPKKPFAKAKSDFGRFLKPPGTRSSSKTPAADTFMANAALCKLFGRTHDELVGASDIDLFSPEDARQIAADDQDVLEGHFKENIEELVIGGESRVFDTVKVPMRGAGGEVVGICGIARDITDKRLMEDELAKADKLESIGLLAGGIAHDFNNILAAILGNVSLARMETADSPETQELLASAEKATERARDLTHQLLTFSKGGAPVKQVASVAKIIEESAAFSLHGSNVKCTLDLEPDLPGAEVDPGQISQVIHNLILNADQAMPDGGELLVSAGRCALTEDTQLPLAPGEYLRISVKDQGCGIPEEHLNKIFDPFFTTRSRGNGLGLATAFSIVKKTRRPHPLPLRGCCRHGIHRVSSGDFTHARAAGETE